MIKKIINRTLFSASAVYLILKVSAAKREERSVESLIVDDVIRLNSKHTTHREREYHLPLSAKKFHGFTRLSSYANVYHSIPNTDDSKHLIFYLHGGAYWSQPNALTFNFLSKIARKLGARIVLPIYPKAPYFNALETLDMVKESYRYLIEDEKVDPATITIMGDSAGGGLSLALLQTLRDEGLALPKCGVLLSPWLDISNTNHDMKRLQDDDVMLDLQDLRFKGEIYAGPLDIKDSRVSPLYGDFKGLPPLMIVAGTHDILYPDALKLKHMHKEITLDVYPKMAHVFSLMPIPEARKSMNRMIQFIKKR